MDPTPPPTQPPQKIRKRDVAIGCATLLMILAIVSAIYVTQFAPPPHPPATVPPMATATRANTKPSSTPKPEPTWSPTPTPMPAAHPNPTQAPAQNTGANGNP